MTAPVDISPEAVERVVDALLYDKLIPVTATVETLRALRAALTTRDEVLRELLDSCEGSRVVVGGD